MNSCAVKPSDGQRRTTAPDRPGSSKDGYRPVAFRHRLFRTDARLRPSLRTTLTLGVSAMLFEYILGAATAAFLCGYLIYALVRPERF
ncbi:K(+)-transporting ATPase subunit F [Pleomorphomonas carboxyditropha]|uniref:K(+)-transporting ATPase subunit F n=1 Tax=Pleomorphomonas carboxyditropha TaxID=2023338 RepID=A0A2G9WU79_9HYPH|nr:K(+)-transporting ATPase subunit F [Pleomorphomonas carboxyditropha]